MENKEIDEKVSNQINRMKEMMNYGLKNETKNYNSVEYSRMGADGNTYGIVREGAKYHIKVANVKNPSKSDFNYIGGFANHKENMFESFANAQKHFDMKMRSLNEAYGKTSKNIDSWNLEGRNDVLNEMTDKMRLEIYRQREIMNNANVILEGKDKAISKEKASSIEKNNIKISKATIGDAKGNGGDFFTEKPDSEFSDTQKNNIKGKQTPVVENVENEIGDLNIASNNEGDGAGQTNVMGGSLGEEEEFDETDVDVTADEDGDVDVDVDVESTDDDIVDDFEAEAANDELEEFPSEDEEEFEDDSLTAENEGNEVAALRGEVEDLRSIIDAIAEKLGVNEFDKDEPLYDDASDDEDFESEEDDFEVEEDGDGDVEVEFESEEDDDEDDSEVFESRGYQEAMLNEALKDKIKSMAKDAVSNIGKGAKKAKKMIKKGYNNAKDKYDHMKFVCTNAPNKSNIGLSDEELKAQLDDFNKKEAEFKAEQKRKKREREELDETELHVWGKHPRYQKEPMTYPNPKMEKTDGQYDEGEGEETTRKPYGKKIGDGKFFDQSKGVEHITNSIAESLIRKLREKNV